MSDLLAVALPFLSVLLGGAITYAANVRQRRRGKVEEVFHEAIAAVAVAAASRDWIKLEPWAGASEAEAKAFVSELDLEGNRAHARAVAQARAAVARASAYDPSLARYLAPSQGPAAVIYTHADELMAALRAHTGGRKRP